MVKYNKLISFFRSSANSNDHISFKYLKKKTDLVRLTNQNKFQLIINCERSNMLTEKFLRNEVYKNYYNKAFTTIIYHAKVINNKAVQIFTEYGPIAFLPLSNKSTSVVFSFEIKKKEKISENECELSNEQNCSWMEVECLGACVNAPMMQINDEYYEDLDKENFEILLNKLKNSEKINNGSQIGRKSSEPKRN